jgi:hypothetical protein
LLAPYGYAYTTFAQINMGSTSGTSSFTGSNFISSGLAPNTDVPYSVYYSTYQNITSSKLIVTGTLNNNNPAGSFIYNYNATSGSIITFLFNQANL